jgi:hypothetical protein
LGSFVAGVLLAGILALRGGTPRLKAKSKAVERIFERETHGSSCWDTVTAEI